MTPTKVNKRVIGDRVEWIDKMVDAINSLPLRTYEAFSADDKNLWAAESCLRRALEAIFDVGRHILATGFGKGVSEYKAIATELEKAKVLSQDEMRLFRILAGYRNRLVHFYHEVTHEELYNICKNDLNDILTIRDAYLQWLKRNPEIIDESL